MNRYKRRFNQLKKKKDKALVPFVTIGDPDYKTSLEIVKTIIDNGADVLELGFVFSEPIADGPTIQTAGVRALKKGANTDRNFNFIQEIRKYDCEIPIGILVYSNMIYQRGIKRFYQDCAKSGIDSVLVADLPIEEAEEYIKAARNNKVDAVFIVSPLTDKKRLKKVIKKTRGFVYIVSRLGVTGARKDIQESTLKLIRRVKKHTKLPSCVGFGISRPEHVKSVLGAGADGAIVGSAVVKIIEKNLKRKKVMLDKVGNFIKRLKNATKDN